MLSPSSCRLWHGKFWMRILLVAGGLAGYQRAVTATMAKLQPTFMTTFAANWATVWESEMTYIEAIKKAEAENQDLKGTEVTATKAGKDHDSWYGKLGKYVVDALLTGIGWVLAVVAGLVITVFMPMEGFTGLGLNMLLVAVGPVCVAFAAHETESYFWGFLKALLFIGLLCMPLLGLACQFAGVIMAQMTTMVTGMGVVYGDGSDIGVHFLMVVVLGPFCAFAVVRAAPMFLGMVLGTGGGGAGGGAAFAMGAVAARQSTGGGGSGGGGAGPSMAVNGAGGAELPGESPAVPGSMETATSAVDGPGSVADLRGE